MTIEMVPGFEGRTQSGARIPRGGLNEDMVILLFERSHKQGVEAKSAG